MELKETEGEEELEHRKALLQRETLIQSLGSVKQLACMLHLRQQGQNPPPPPPSVRRGSLDRVSQDKGTKAVAAHGGGHSRGS